MVQRATHTQPLRQSISKSDHGPLHFYLFAVNINHHLVINKAKVQIFAL